MFPIVLAMDEEQRRQLESVFRRHPAIRAVYLFGSVAEGRGRTGSDLDLAVIPADGFSADDKLDLLADLAREGFCDVDLVILDGNDLVLAYEAVRLNRLIYATPGFDQGSTYSRIVRMYLDFEPHLRAQREAYKQRIVHGST